jgi:subtilase family serine protease
MNSSWNGKALAVCAACLLFAQIALAQSTAVAPRITQAVDESKLVTLTGNTHRMAQSRYDQGPAPDSLPLERLMVVLKRSPQQETALQNLLEQLQDKNSPNFHKWLTPAQFGKQFGPADEDIQIVKNWLEGHGFQVTNIATGRTVIEFSGTSALVRQAFHTDIHKFFVNGEEHWANTRDPQIPAALAPVVGGIKSLNSFFKRPMHVVVRTDARAVVHQGQKPAITFTDGSHALVPGDFATIYNVAPVYNANVTGSGRTIGIIGRSNINVSDVQDFRNLVGLVPANNVPTVVVNGPDPGDLGDGEELEALLDNEWGGAIGPAATVKFVVSKTTATEDGVDLSELFIVDNNLTDVMSESFSLCEADLNNDINNSEVQFELQVTEQAAAQGISFVAATGDAGANSCDDPNSETVATGPVSIGLPAGVPFTTAVGGTQFNSNGDDAKYWNNTSNNTNLSSALSYIPEDVWNNSCVTATCLKGVSADEDETPSISAGGGGASAIFPKPAYQMGITGNPADGHRDTPDVSFNAAGSVCATVSAGKCTTVHSFGYVICQASAVPANETCASANPALLIVGGTSASTPSFAGILSLVDQKTNSRQGNANVVLYHLASEETFSQCNASTLEPGAPPAATCVFNDVTVGNNSVPINSGGAESAGFTAGTGSDLASGLGSINVNNLVNNWGSVAFTATTTTLTLSSSSLTQGQTLTLSGTVTGGSGTPTGDVGLIATSSTLGGLGFATLDGSGNYTLSIPASAMASGSYTIVARYAGDTTLGTSESAPSSITVAGGGGGGGGTFSVSANPTSASVSPGQSASSTVTVTGSGGFAGSVALSATVSGPAGAVDTPVCSFAPASITLSTTSTSDTSALSCTTMAASQVMYMPSRGPGRPVWVGVGATLAMACVFFLSWPVRKRRWATAFAFLVLASAALAVGCSGGGGGGNKNPGTTPGAYTVTVTGTSSTTQTAMFTITVQ